jgi:hypothetical protein
MSGLPEKRTQVGHRDMSENAKSGHMLKFQKDVTERACLTHSVAISPGLRQIE